MASLKIYNSLHNRIEEFHPIQEGKASIYVCGPTVYSSPHIGNFRPIVVFDVLRRLLIALGYQVTFVSNYTDVDDKIIKRAKELGITEKELTEGVIAEFSSLVDQVGALQPDVKPRPTVYMPQIIQYVKDLVDVGAAYVAPSGNVYFRVGTDPSYGILSGNTPDQLKAGARIEVGEEKESPLDFALWKITEEGIRWDSPWGKGRPGWHTECCVMINSIFREQNGLIDIHGGGFDLKFPHHENEIAQSMAHNHNHLANYWMHNGFIDINNQKMSKSLGNVLLAKDVVGKYGGMAFRLMLLDAQYRAPVSFREETILEAQRNVAKLESVAKGLSLRLQMADVDLASLPACYGEGFLEAMEDDLNTPNALARLYEDAKVGNQLLRNPNASLDALKEQYAKLASEFFVLGLTSLKGKTLSEDDKKQYSAYLEAKKRKDFATSDAIRGSLLEKGIL